MHDISQSAHSPGYNSNLLHRLGIFLQGADQCVSYLMIGDDTALLLTHDTILLFLTHHYLLYCIKQILLAYTLSAFLYRIDGSFIDHIGKVGAHCAACGKGDGIQIHSFIHLHILGMYLQDLHTALQIRLIYDNPSIKTSRTKQSLVQDLRMVGSAQDQNSLGGIKAIHLRKQLV